MKRKKIGNIKMDNIKVDWQNWDNGTKMIFAATCVAVFSIFLPWADIGFVTANGFRTYGFLLLGLYAYQFLQILKNQYMNKKLALGLSAASVVLSLVWYFNNSAKFGKKVINVSGVGLYLFILASIVLLAGVWMSSKSKD